MVSGNGKGGDFAEKKEEIRQPGQMNIVNFSVTSLMF